MHTTEDATSFVEAFLAEPFSNDPRHERRIAMLAAYEDTGALPPLPAGATEQPSASAPDA
jgi:ribose 5-phosphate isomerase B